MLQELNQHYTEKPKMFTIKDLQNAITEVFEHEAESITINTTAPEIDGWDSLGHFRMLHYLEEKYSIEFDIQDMESMDKFGDLIEIVN